MAVKIGRRVADTDEMIRRCLNCERVDCRYGDCGEIAVLREQAAAEGRKRRTLLYEYHGERHSIAEWAEITGILPDTLYKRVRYWKIPIDRAIEAGPTRVTREWDAFGIRDTMAGWARRLGVHRSTLESCVIHRANRDMEAALRYYLAKQGRTEEDLREEAPGEA